MSLSSPYPSTLSFNPSPFTLRKPTRVGRFTAIPQLAGVVSASRLEIRPALKLSSSGIQELDALTGGLPRGCLTEVCGPSSSGRTSVLLSIMAAATLRNEVCALVDVSDAFDPASALAAEVNFERMLWVRCGGKKCSPKNNNNNKDVWEPVEQALRVTDLLLQSGGFGLVVIDLGDIPMKSARRIPLTTWFRFQRAVENTPTILFVVAATPCTQTCANLLLKLQASCKKLSAVSSQLSENRTPAHSKLLGGLEIKGELLRSRMERKPMQSVTSFATMALRTG